MRVGLKPKTKRKKQKLIKLKSTLKFSLHTNFYLKVFAFFFLFLAYLAVGKGEALESWRREWDSNPRWRLNQTRFPSVRLQPLGHLSVRSNRLI